MVVAVFEIFEIQPGKHFVNALVYYLAAEAVIQRSEDHVFVYCRHEHLVVGVLQHKAEPGADLAERFFFYLDAVDQHFALTLQQAEQELHDGGLACTVGTDQSDRFSLFDPERHVVQDFLAFFICEIYTLEFNHLYHLTTSPPMS